ncbi:MAG: PAS domain S-box protein [Gammaproteobacteria bacterium]|nr:PAS domain S-box protein [Gammaproteobacteria bacterium]
MNEYVTGEDNNLHLASEILSVASPVVMQWSAENNGQIFEVSTGITKLGYAVSDFNRNRTPASKLIHPLDYLSITDELRLACKNEQRYISQTFRVLNSQKQVRWVNCLSILPPSNDGALNNLKSVFIDITEHCNSQREQGISEKGYQRIIANSGANYFFYIHNKEGVFTHLSPSVQDMLGYTEDEFLNHYNTFLSNSPINKGISLRTDKALLGIRQKPYHIEVLHKDGRKVRIEVTEVPTFDDHGEVASVIGMAHDITELYHKQHLLEQSQKQLKAIFDGLSDSIIIINSHHHIVSINKAAEELFGYSELETRDLLITDIMSSPRIHGKLVDIPSASDEIFKNLERLSRGNTPIEALSYSKSNTNQSISINVSFFPGSDNLYILSVKDITKEKSHALQLQRVEKMDALGKMTSGICHDFNNVLGIISGYTTLLEGLKIDDPHASSYIEHIRNASDRGARLSQKLLFFSGKNTSKSKSLFIDDILKQESDMLSDMLSPLVTLDISRNKGLWPVSVNQGDLEDVVLNICLNARHAMPNGGSLKISTRNTTLNEDQAFSIDVAPGDYVLLSIKDSGTGIDEGILSKIFDPFFSTKQKGTGLGLSQTYKFVRGAKGGITVISELNKGSEFSIYLPRNLQKESSASPTSEKSKNNIDSSGDSFSEKLSQHSHEIDHAADIYKSATQKPKQDIPSGLQDTTPSSENEIILVVDGDDTSKEAILTQLLNRGYTAYSASNGTEALKILSEKNIALIIAGIIMPELNGWALASEVDKKYPHIIIQLITSHTQEIPPHQSALYNKLSATLLHKPVSESSLLERIDNLFYLKQISQAN